jgi:hypothetical protein
MIIHRDFSLAERDDYRINVLSRINNLNYAVPIKSPKNELVGWIIKDLRPTC